MPLDGASRNQLLTAVAGVLRGGQVREADALESAVKAAAAELGGDLASATPADLFEALPSGWRANPAGSSTRSEAEAWLKVADPVLGVDAGAIRPVVARGMTAAKQAEAVMIVNRARMASTETPAQSAPLDFLGDPRAVRDAIVALKDDKAFVARMGGDKYAGQIGRALDEAAIAAASAVKRDGPAPQVLAGGVPVPLPADDGRPLADKPWAMVADGKLPMTAGRLASVLVELALIRGALDEVTYAKAVTGADTNVVSGRVPTADAIPVGVRRGEQVVEIGFSVDDEALRRFRDTNDSAEVIGGRIEELMRRAFTTMGAQREIGVPPALAVDPHADLSGVVAPT